MTSAGEGGEHLAHEPGQGRREAVQVGLDVGDKAG